MPAVLLSFALRSGLSGFYCRAGLGEYCHFNCASNKYRGTLLVRLQAPDVGFGCWGQRLRRKGCTGFRVERMR